MAKSTMLPSLKVIRAVTKRMPFLPKKTQNDHLSYCCGDMADAYQLGAEEAQEEILVRINQLVGDVHYAAVAKLAALAATQPANGGGE